VSEALAITDVTKRFGDFTAVDSFSLRVPSGEVVGFLGPNGAGKTTTIRMIMSILHPDSGTIRVLDHPDASDVKDRIGYLPEERGLYRKMTVEATLRYFGKLKGLRGADLRRRCDEALERVSLSDWRRRRVEALSKGMQQKLQFVSTLLNEPDLVILDEPFSGLDPINADMLERLLGDLRRAGVTVIFSTHQMEQAERLCDRIVLINRGRKLIDGTMGEIRERFHSRILILEGQGDFRRLETLEGVANGQSTGGSARLELQDGVDSHAILRKAIDLVRITHFEVQRPNLQDIFVKLVGDDAPEAVVDHGAD
jgi:ABC-2 type transport system ATP-binding protein